MEVAWQLSKNSKTAFLHQFLKKFIDSHNSTDIVDNVSGPDEGDGMSEDSGDKGF